MILEKTSVQWTRYCIEEHHCTWELMNTCTSVYIEGSSSKHIQGCPNNHKHHCKHTDFWCRQHCSRGPVTKVQFIWWWYHMFERDTVLDNPSIFPTVVLELKAFVMLACNTQEIPLRMWDIKMMSWQAKKFRMRIDLVGGNINGQLRPAMFHWDAQGWCKNCIQQFCHFQHQLPVLGTTLEVNM